MAASLAGKLAVVELLLAKGADPNARGPRAQTALMWAVAQKHADVVKLLLARGADVHARSERWEQMMAVPPHGLPEYNPDDSARRRHRAHGSRPALAIAVVGEAARRG